MIAANLVPVLKLIGKTLSKRPGAAVGLERSEFLDQLSIQADGQNRQDHKNHRAFLNRRMASLLLLYNCDVEDESAIHPIS